MAQYCQQKPHSTGVIMHTLQRHQEILKDHTNEFHKTRSSIEEQINRDRLLGNVNKKGLGFVLFSFLCLKNGSILPRSLRFSDFSYSGVRKSDFLMKENESIRK